MGLIVVLTLARGLHFVAVSVLCGASLFQLYAPRAARSASALSKSALQGWVLLLVVSGVAWAGGLVAAITGDLANLISADVLRGFFLETGFGRVWLFRFVLMLLVALVVVTAPHASKASADASHKPSRRMHFVLYLSTAALLISQAWIGHSFAVIKRLFLPDDLMPDAGNALGGIGRRLFDHVDSSARSLGDVAGSRNAYVLDLGRSGFRSPLGAPAVVSLRVDHVSSPGSETAPASRR